MAASHRAAWALALLLVPAPVMGGPAEVHEATIILAPVVAPGAGVAVAFRVAVEGPPGDVVELRAWLEGGGTARVQVWDGAAWARADRYQVAWTLDAEGRREGWLAVRAMEAEEAPQHLRLRVRDDRARVVAEAAWALAAPTGQVRTVLAPPGTHVVAAWEGPVLAGLSPAHPWVQADGPWGLEGRATVRSSQAARLSALGAEGEDLGPVEARSPDPLRIAALLVDPAADEAGEFVRVVSLGEGPAPLAGWWVGGPGWRAVASGGVLGPGQQAAFVRDASAYRAVTGREDALASRTEGSFQLPNAGGEVLLGFLDQVVDRVAWGRAAAEGEGWHGPPLPVPRPGQLHRRLPGHPDTDRAGDFDVARAWMAGWGERPVEAFDARVTAFTREDALATALAALAEAREEVLVELYELRHPDLAGALHAAMARGARVHVLVEGAPVGGMSAEQRALLDGLAGAGADVRTLGGSGRDRFGTAHAKVAVLDRATLLLGSENWTPSGFPASGGGNLGWGVVARSPALAARFAEVFLEDADLARGDVRRWEPSGTGHVPAAPPAGRIGEGDPALARLLLVPDNALDAMLDLIAGARATLDVEALQLQAAWSSGPSPVLEALRGAAARGVRVRVLLDGAPGTDNALAAGLLNQEAEEWGWDLAARLHRGARVHNKGILVDGEAALVGSINLGEASMTRNREAALLLEGDRAAAPLRAAFEADWASAAPLPEPVRAEPAWLAAPLAAMAALAVWRGRRR